MECELNMQQRFIVILMKLIRTYILLFSLLTGSVLFSQTVPGILKDADTVCAYHNSGVLQLSGYTGSVLRWEYSFNGSSLWTTISNTSDSYNYIDLSQTTYFRTIVQNTGYPEEPSNVIKITVDDSTKAGYSTVTSAMECAGNSVKMTLHDYKGSILNWQYSTDNAITWNDIAQSNDSTTKYFSNLTVRTLFRAMLKNGVCGVRASDSVEVIAMPKSIGGVVSSNATVCEGANGDTLRLTGQTGTIVRWESSPTGSDPWTTINNTATSLVYKNLTANTYYRTVVKSGNCAEAVSTPVFISVDKATNPGFISGTQTVCKAVNTGTLQLNAANGKILQWEFSTDGGTTWTKTAVDTSIFNFSNLTQDMDYRVELVNGVCPAVHTNSFHVTVKPVPLVSYTFTQGCQGKSVSFTNTTTGANLYNWDFNDGNGSSVFSPTHIYLTSGVFQVKLTATSTNGCSDSLKKSITIYAQPTVNFSVLDSACGSTQLLFKNNSGIASGVINDYVWNFGDNTSTTTEVNPTHTYSVANIYKVKLVATSDMGCKDSITKPVEIFPKPIANYTTSNVCKKTAASFVNTSYINGGGIVNNWNFGDGQLSTLTSPTHTYTLAGDYNVRLITVSNHNCTDTIIKTIRIHEQPDLSINTSNVCLTKATIFTQSIKPAVSNYKLNWNFGNGDVSTGLNPTYVYPVPGTYTVTAAITTDSGCVTTATKVTTIYPLSKPLFSFNNVCDSDSVLITNQSTISTGSMSYLWDFGNTTTSTVINPRLKYELAGNYMIKLLVTTDKGCKDSLSKPITIYDSPVSSFDFKNVCDGKPVEFINTSTVKSGTITNNNWNFGDNSNSTLLNPIKLYAHFGTYPVVLQTVSSNGCKSSITKTVSVFEGPIANFSFVNQCLNKPLPFTNLSTLTNGTYDSFWDFGDHTTSPLNSPEHFFQTPGTKKVKLIVSTSNGCTDSISKTVEAFPIPIVFAGNDTTISNGYSVQLKATGAYTYAWSPAEGLNNPTLSNPVANPYKTTAYIVEGTSINGCSSTDTIVITIEDDFLVIPYNIVTPNGNGKNDAWVVRNIERYPKNKITILDEWGVMVYEQKGYENNWEGRNSRGEILPDGTYFYVLTFEDNKKIYKGFITLLRNK